MKTIDNNQEDGSLRQDVHLRGRVRVYVGFAWQHVDHILKDSRWAAIKKYFKATNEYVEQAYGVGVDFRRLRASHGRFIWESIREKIEKADVLIFDVAAIPEQIGEIGSEVQYQALNGNVVLELGAALAKDRAKILLLCPQQLTGMLPSDLSGLLYTSYSDVVAKHGVERKYDDKWGVLPQYRSMVSEVIEDKGWGVGDDDEDAIPQEEIERVVVKKGKKK